MFKKLKERYDWKGYTISSIIVSVGALIFHYRFFQSLQIETFLITLLFVWVFMLVVMIGMSELLK